jgi:hypothetical protein
MDNIKSKRLTTIRRTGSAGSKKGLLSPEEVIDSLGPDAFGDGEKEPEEGARDLYEKLTDFAEKSPELSPELSSEEAPEAFFLEAETKLKTVEADMGKENSNATHNQKEDFSKGVTIIHSLFSGEEIPSFSENYLTSTTDEATLEQKIAKVIKQFSTNPAA